MSQAIDSLREEIAAIAGRSIVDAPPLPFGVDALDGRLAHGGLRIDALHEIAPASGAPGDDAAASLFAAGIAARNAGPVLWVTRRRDLFAPGLYQAGLGHDRLIRADARDDAEMLAVMEDALRHRGLSAVVGEAIRAGLVATRRLQLAAEGGGALALLIRRPAKAADDPLATPSAAMTRWRIGCAPSAPLPVAGVGRACWRVALVRQRGGDPFELLVEACDETGRCAVVAGLADRSDPARGADARAAA